MMDTMVLDQPNLHMVNDSPLPFIEAQPLASDISEKLFSWFFESQEFEHWHVVGPSWQLRCIGGPGSGKTALSALTVHRLRKSFPDPSVGVAAIFFVRLVQDAENEILKCFLRSVLQQWSGDTLSISNHDDLESIRTALLHQIRPSRRLFLVVDDLDLCNQKMTIMIEQELETLRKQLGLSIMVTSRLPHKYDNLLSSCDVLPNDLWHKNQIIPMHWCCSTCKDSTSTRVIVCQSCRKDYVCKTCGSKTRLHEPYHYVDIVMQIPEDSMREFVAMELEQAHGNLGLHSSCVEKPHWSKLGRALMEGKTTNSAQMTLDRIVMNAGGNVAMAKLRLEAMDVSQSVDDLLRIADRLPDNIQAIFDAGISRINQKSRAEAALGLKAIFGVATIHAGEPFSELQQWLHQQADLTAPTIYPSDQTIQEVLHAASGFIVCDTWNSKSIVTLYHDAFAHYVAEDYNETFVWVRSEMQYRARPRSSSITLGTRKTSMVSENSTRPQLGPRSPPLIQDLGILGLDRKGTITNQSGPKRQTTEPGSFKEDKNSLLNLDLLRRTTNWL